MTGFPPKISGLKVILFGRFGVIKEKVLAALAYVNEETPKEQAWMIATTWRIFIEKRTKGLKDERLYCRD
jgi:hypothetical protein